MDKSVIKARQNARKLTVQAMYQWRMSGSPLSSIEVQFCTANNMEKVDIDYFQRLLHEIPKRITEIDEAYRPFLDRTIDELNPVELAVLRVGAFELIYCLEIPYRIVLDEAVRLAKLFGSQDGHRYVNGVLHNLAKMTREDEMNTYGG